jgi:hypothetical protein
MPAENNVTIRLNVRSDTGAIARTQALLRTLGSDADRSGKLFGKTAKNIDFTKRSLTAFEKSAVVASKVIGKTFKLALMNAGAQMLIFGAGISTVNGLFRIGQGAAKLYKFAMSGLAGAFAMAAAGAGVFAAAMREQTAAMSSFQYTSQKQFGPSINQARAALSNLERDAKLAVLGTKALTSAFQAASKHSEFTGASQSALKQMANFALASGNPEKAMQAAGDFVGLLEKRKASIAQIQKAMKATMGDDMYKKIQQANAKAKKEDKVNLGSVKGIREAVMSGKLAKMAGVENMLDTMNGTLIGQLKSYMGQAKSLFADFGQPLLAPVKDAFKQIFHTLKFAFAKISVSFQQFAGKSGLPAIVKVVDKLSNMIVDMTQKYLPGAVGWWAKFAKPFQYMTRFFKETLPNTLRPYRESAKVITDMFGKIFGPSIGGNVRRVSDLISDNKVELLDFASGVGKLLQNLNKLSGEIMKAFFRLLPILTPVINSIASLVGMIAKVFGALGNLGGLGGGSGGGTNIIGSLMSGLMLTQMFRGKKFLGNRDSYTQGASNSGFMGRMWNRQMGLKGTGNNPNDAYFTNRYARQMAMATGNTAMVPTYGAGGVMVPGAPGAPGAGGGGAAGGAGGAGAGGGQLSMSFLTGQRSRGGREFYDQSSLRGRVGMTSPSLMTPEQLIYNEETRLHGVGTVQGQVQRRLMGMGYDPDRIDHIKQAPGALLGQMKNSGAPSFTKTSQEMKDELDRLRTIGGTGRTFREERTFQALTTLQGRGDIDALARAEQEKSQFDSDEKRAQTLQQRKEARAASAAAGGNTGLTPFQRKMQANREARVEAAATEKGQKLLAKSQSLEARGLNYEAQARAAAAAGDHAEAARLQAKADQTLHKSAVVGGESDKLLKKYAGVTDSSGLTTGGQKAGDTERRTSAITGRTYYRDDLATRSDRAKNEEQGYSTGSAGGKTVEGKLEQLRRRRAEFQTQGASLRADAANYQSDGKFLRSKLTNFKASIAERRANGGIFGVGQGRQLSELQQAAQTSGGARTGAGFRGRMAGLNFKRFASGSFTGKLGPGGPGLLGAKDAETGQYKSRTGRVLGGQSMGANVATSMGMSFLASKGVGDEGGMALGASLAPMFGPMAAIGVGFGVSALKAKTAKGGAAAGAIAGAAIGSMVPGIGTAVGAAIGAVVGFAAGTINRNKLEKKAAKGVAQSIVKGFEQKASYDAFTKYSNLSGKSGTTRADYVNRGFNQVIKMAKAFGDAGGKANTDEVRGNMIDQMVSSGMITEKQGKDAKKRSTSFTRELEKQAKAYTKIGKILKDSYDPKIQRMADLTGKSAAEIEKMADAMGVSLLDPTLKSIDALKQLGFFVEKTAQTLKTELSNAMIDAVAGLQEFVKTQEAPLVMNEIAQGFGEKGRAGAYETTEVVDFLTSVMTNAQVVNPDDPAEALRLFMDTVGMGADGKINPNARVFADKTSPLYGTFESFSKAGGFMSDEFEKSGGKEGGINALVGEIMNAPETGLKSKVAFGVYDQLQALATSGNFALPQSVLETLNTKMSPDQLAQAYSRMTTEKAGGRMSISQDLIDNLSDPSPSVVKDAEKKIQEFIIARTNYLLGDQAGTLGLETTDLTPSTTAGEKSTQTAIDLMSESETAILQGLTDQWSSIAKSMSTGSAPNWFKDTPAWWSNAPSWYGDTTAPKGVKPQDTSTSRVQQTLDRHRQIDSGITGKRTVTSSLRNFNLGSLNSDHKTGRAYDLVGQNLGAYGVAVRKSGGFAEFHGGQANRHLHVVPGTGDSSMPSIVGVQSSGGGSVANSYNITINGTNQDPEAIANAVMEKIKRSQRSMNERS